MHRRNTNNVYAVILVGGKGKRLRPLSTNSRPKAFLSITRDRKTMFGMTLNRARKITTDANILVVANRLHAGLVKRDFPGLRSENLILEPVSRNTAPAITLAAFALGRRSIDPVMVVLPTDQYIIESDRPGYLESVKVGIGFAASHSDALMVLGVRPRYPATGFGYIKTIDHRPKTRDPKIYKVEKFEEKPDLKTAKRYVKSGKYLWNAGTFFFRVDALLTAVRKFAPRIFEGLVKSKSIRSSYGKLPDISIDYAIFEKARNIHCVKGSYEWHDMGSFESLKTILERESRRYTVKGERVTKIL